MECEITKPRKEKEEVVQKLVQVTENKEQKTEQEKVRQKKASDAKEKKENKKEMEVEKPFKNLQMKESNRNHAVSSKGTLFIKFVFISFLCSLFLEQNDNLDACESYNSKVQVNSPPTLNTNILAASPLRLDTVRQEKNCRIIHSHNL